MASYYPPVGFHFKVEFIGIAANDGDTRFSEVAGLAMESPTEEVPEGGENRYVQKYPGRAKYAELVLKRGLLVNSQIIAWVRACIQDLTIRPADVDVKLLNEKHEPLMTWHLAGAYPTKWSCSDLNASNNAVVVESMQLYYKTFSIDTQ